MSSTNIPRYEPLGYGISRGWLYEGRVMVFKAEGGLLKEGVDLLAQGTQEWLALLPVYQPFLAIYDLMNSTFSRYAIRCTYEFHKRFPTEGRGCLSVVVPPGTMGEVMRLRLRQASEPTRGRIRSHAFFQFEEAQAYIEAYLFAQSPS